MTVCAEWVKNKQTKKSHLGGLSGQEKQLPIY